MRRAKEVATRLAAGGSVVGSISKKLQAMDVDLNNAEAIAMEAVIARSRVERLHGVGIVGFGICVVLSAYLLSLFFIRGVVVSVAITGVFFVMLGVARVFHRSRILRPRPRSRSAKLQ